MFWLLFLHPFYPSYRVIGEWVTHTEGWRSIPLFHFSSVITLVTVRHEFVTVRHEFAHKSFLSSPSHSDEVISLQRNGKSGLWDWNFFPVSIHLLMMNRKALTMIKMFSKLLLRKGSRNFFLYGPQVVYNPNSEFRDVSLIFTSKDREEGRKR